MFFLSNGRILETKCSVSCFKLTPMQSFFFLLILFFMHTEAIERWLKWKTRECTWNHSSVMILFCRDIKTYYSQLSVYFVLCNLSSLVTHVKYDMQFKCITKKYWLHKTKLLHKSQTLTTLYFSLLFLVCSPLPHESSFCMLYTCYHCCLVGFLSPLSHE